MPLFPWIDLLDTLRPLLATGASPDDLLALALEQQETYQWPTQQDEWEAFMHGVAEAAPSWEVVLGLAERFIEWGSPLTYPMAFSALPPVMRMEQERFGLLRRILVRYRDGRTDESMDEMADWLTLAGIPPASLLLCSYPTLDTSRVEALIREMGSRVAAFQPVGYDLAPWQKDIAQWIWDDPMGQPLDGLACSTELEIFPRNIGANAVDRRTILGNQMVVGGRLKVGWLPNLQTLGNDLHVYGDLDIHDLPSLTHVGDRIRVEGNLSIGRCGNLSEFPSDLFVRGMIHVHPTTSELAAQIAPGKHWPNILFPRVPSGLDIPPALEDLWWPGY